MHVAARAVPLVLLAAACGRAERPAAGVPAAAAAAPSIHPGDLAGKWAMTTYREGSDSVLLEFEFVAAGGDSGWTFHFPARDPVPVRIVAVAGDSIITATGPYPSALRKDVQVSTRSVMRLSRGILAGRTVATYSTGEEVRLRARGVRKQEE